MNHTSRNPCIVEFTVISAQGIKISSSFFFRRLRPFATVSTTPQPPFAVTTNSGSENVHKKLYITQVDSKGGENPTWDVTFQVNLDDTFFSQRHPALYLNLYSRNLVRGQTHLGWCVVPVADILDGMLPAGTVGHLSYRLRENDGTWGHGVVNVAVKLLEGSVLSATQLTSPPMPQMDHGLTVVGIPMIGGNGLTKGNH